MSNFERTKADPTKITGPYPLLGLFLIVVEGLLGFWLFRAEDSLERIVAGILMTSILAGFLFVFFRMRKDTESESVRPQGLPGNVTPAEKEATEVEVASPEADMMAGPNQSYIIAKPPAGWRIGNLTFRDWVTGNLGISDSAAKQQMMGEDSGDRNILSFSAPGNFRIGFTPGQSLLDGRKVLTALGAELAVRLAVLPMERVQPPLYVERPLEHNFQTTLGQVAGTGIVTLRQLQSGVMKGSGRRFLLAEFRQDMVDVTVNEVAQKNISVNVTMIGIEGELRDHLIIMNYPSLPDNRDSQLEQQLQILQHLVSSFRPLKVADPEAEHRKIMQLADAKFQELFDTKGSELFFTEFYILILRITGMDLSDPTSRHDAIRQLKPFETFAKELGLQEEELSSLWNAMHEAEKGDAAEFKKQIADIIEIMSAKKNVESPKEIGPSMEDEEHPANDE